MVGHTKKLRACAIVGEDDPNLNKSRNKKMLRQALRMHMESIITDHECREFISGMHRGGELLGAELAMELRNEYGIKLWGILSSEEQWIEWTAAERDYFFALMEKADYEYRATNRDTEESRRIQLNVIEEESDIFIVFRGTENLAISEMLRKAVKKGKKVFIVNTEKAEILPYLKLI